jgi:hypothetical protein
MKVYIERAPEGIPPYVVIKSKKHQVAQTPCDWALGCPSHVDFETCTGCPALDVKTKMSQEKAIKFWEKH